MAFHDLRAFLERLEAAGRLRRVAAPVDPDLESTPFCLRAQRSGGHALLFGQPGRSKHPLLGNLFGAPYDEPWVLALALNDMFVPILRKVCPQVVDFYLPPEACSYRVTVVSIRKQYPGHARRVMMGIWSYLRQFTYTKFVIVTDDDIDVRDWAQVIWAVSTRVDPARDSLIVENTPIDFLDFSSPVPNLGSKLGLDATHKWPGGDDAAMESPDRARSGRRATRGRALESGLRAVN